MGLEVFDFLFERIKNWWGTNINSLRRYGLYHAHENCIKYSCKRLAI